MPSLRNGSVRLFRFAGIDLFLHWSWFLVAAYEINGRSRTYSSLTWNVLEYLSLFLIVMLHEFGHALACRQVGGNIRRSTATSRRHIVEHRSRPAGECGARSNPDWARLLEQEHGMVRGHA
jgi:hypothetical protein